MTAATITPPAADSARLRKLLTLALDAGATEGEQVAAAKAVVRIARDRGWNVDELAAALGAKATNVTISTEPARPFGWHVVMPFGRHKGLTLGAIAETQPDYLAWLAENAKLEVPLRVAVTSVLAWIQRGAA